MDDNEVWDAVLARRGAIADLLSGLTADEWNTPSLCERWTVRDVAAHLTMPLLRPHELVVLGVRYRGRTNRLIRDGSIELARRYEPAELVARLRSLSGLRRHVIGLTCREALMDVIGHEQDIAIPLGRDVTPPQHHVAEAADRVLSYGGRGKARVFRNLPLDGVRLVAVDHDWATGSGPEVTGTILDLYLLLIGRRARLDALAGPGADLVVARLGS